MSKKLKDRLVMAVIFFVVAFIPLAVNLRVVDVNIEEFFLIRNNAEVADVFSYLKSFLLICSSVVIVVIYLVYFFGNRAKLNFHLANNLLFYLPIAFLFFVFSSVLFSRYPITSLFGISERYEGCFVLCAYMIFFMSCVDVLRGKKDVKLVMCGIFFSAVFILLIGLSQFLGKDFLVSDIGRKILLLGYGQDDLEIKPVFDKAYSTLYNPNCLGLYCAMIFPVSASCVFFLKKNWLAACFCFFICLLCILNLFASGSTGGLLGLSVSVVFVLLMFFLRCVLARFSKRYYLVSGLIFLCVSFSFFAPLKNQIDMKVFQLLKAQGQSFFCDLSLENNRMKILHRGGSLTLRYQNGNFELLEDGFVIPPKSIQTSDKQTVSYYDFNKVGEVRFIKNSDDIFVLAVKNISLILGVSDGKLYLLSNKGKVIDLREPIEHFGFDGYEFVASSRGYIWSRSLPLLKKNIIIGGGPDTFVFSFPQNDIIGKLRYHNSPYIIIDKPHNFYLQTAINTGFLSLVCLLALFTYYFFTLVKAFRLRRSGSISLDVFRIGIAGGILSYLVSSLATDSTVSVAPVFWIMLGTGFALNFLRGDGK